MTSSWKNKGKNVVSEPTKLNIIVEINCHNGFKTLEIWDDPGVNNLIGL